MDSRKKDNRHKGSYTQNGSTFSTKKNSQNMNGSIEKINIKMSIYESLCRTSPPANSQKTINIQK